MFKKKSIVLLSLALIFTCVALAGTLAWKSFTQNSISVFEGFVNPSVNLHDDFRSPKKDIFVENSGKDNLYVRVALDEWMTLNNAVIESQNGKLPFFGTDGNDGWLYHNFDGGTADNCGEAFHKYYQWKMGDSNIKNAKYYLKAPFAAHALFNSSGVQTKEPEVVAGSSSEGGKASLFGINPEYDTVSMEQAYLLLEKRLLENFNENMTVLEYLDDLYQRLEEAKQNQDSALVRQLGAELQSYISKPENKLGYYDKIYDIDENGDILESFNITFVPISRTITVKNVLTMEEWISYGSHEGDFWVIDTDGWCYWASSLMPQEATGLLITSIKEKNSPGEAELLYKLSATLQAATYDDIESFWLTSDIGGGGATAQAKELLKVISKDDNTPQLPSSSSSESGNESIKPIFSTDGIEWLVLEERNASAKALIISRLSLFDCSRTMIQTLLETHINKDGGGSLKNIITADANATARLLTADEAALYFKTDADRIALLASSPSSWWLDEKGAVLETGEIYAGEYAGNAGLRVVVELDADALKMLATATN